MLSRRKVGREPILFTVQVRDSLTDNVCILVVKVMPTFLSTRNSPDREKKFFPDTRNWFRRDPKRAVTKERNIRTRKRSYTEFC